MKPEVCVFAWLTFCMVQVRHGESVDNLVRENTFAFSADVLRIFLVNQRDIWAGWKDAPLSNHGTAQFLQNQPRLTFTASIIDVDAYHDKSDI
jgi:bisphosphoglycerate-dependent phosphoglycerate mutase